jgi:PAS domain S-box-containing protein
VEPHAGQGTELLAGIAPEVIDVLPAAVVVLDGGGHVLVWNAAAERLTGWPRTEVVGSTVAGSRLDPFTADRIVDELRAGRPFGGRLPIVPPTGRPLYFRAAPGSAGTIVGVLREVADTRAEDEAFALLDALWETAPVGLAYVDTQLRYRRVNDAVLAMDGGSLEDRLGRTVEEVHGPVGATIADGLRGVLADGMPRLDVPVQGRLWHGRGPFQEWRMYYYPVRGPGGRVVGVGVVIVDVTASERTRRELATVAAEREHALNRYQSLVEATSAAVWIREADGSAVRDAPGLRAITGQSEGEHTGWGFLDAVHPAHRPALEAAWRTAASAEPARAFVRAYRLRTAQGTYRWFRTRAVPVQSGGRVVEWVGTETDIEDARRARDRLDVLARATSAMNAALDPEGELAALADAVVPTFADACRVYLVDSAPLRPGTADVTGRRSVMRLAPGLPPSPYGEDRFTFAADHPVARCARTAAPVLVAVPGSGEGGAMGGVEETSPLWRAPQAQREWTAAAGVNSVIVAPVVARGAVVAALLFLACGDRAPYTEDDLALVGELATRASAAVGNAVAFQRTREVAVALQSAMLSTPPRRPGLEIEARYLPAAAELRVGGDWYDAFELPGGDLAVGIGDVEGHDLRAAATMGQLRSMLRGLAHDSDGTPSEVITRLDRVVCGLGVTRFTTLVYGRLSCGRHPRFRWSSAGHPAPIVLPPDGRAPWQLGGRVDVVLGVDPAAPRRDHDVELSPGATLLLYTDGLVECRNDPADTAGARLLDLVHRGAGLPLPEFCDHLVRGTTADTGDDIAVLALRITG